ncbi:MAG: DUF3015 family protein [Oligoflexia bacterium]|nr:DUF3015 family protein [Oligoflexia bacterium]
MKIFLKFFVILSFSIAANSAEKQFGVGGCGLGSLMMGKDGNQVLAITTNGTGTQTFGISSGTSNCVPDKKIKKKGLSGVSRSEEIKGLVEGNQTATLNDLAKGSGEIIWTISDVYNCEDPLELGEELQKNYKKIVPKVDIDATELSSNIDKVISKSDVLSNSCPNL